LFFPRELAVTPETGEKFWWLAMGEHHRLRHPLARYNFAVGTVAGDMEGNEVFRQLDVNGDGSWTPRVPKSWGPITNAVLDGNGTASEFAEWKASAPNHGAAPALVAVAWMARRCNRTECDGALRALPDLASPLIYQDVLYLVKGGGG